MKQAPVCKAKCDKTNGKCSISFYILDRGDFSIVDPDYTNWTVLKNCQNYFFGLFRQELVWILTRAPDTDTTAAFAAISAKYPSYDQAKNLQETFQSATDCPYSYVN